jgi:hypothetical protein
VARVVELRRAGATIPEILAVLDASGAHPPRAERWCKSTVERILQQAGVQKHRRTIRRRSPQPLAAAIAAALNDAGTQPPAGARRWTPALVHRYA